MTGKREEAWHEKQRTKTNELQVERENKNQKANVTTKQKLKSIHHLPRGGRPPATDDEDGLRMLRDSRLVKDSISEVVNLLPVPLAWDKFCWKNIWTFLIQITNYQLKKKRQK